MTDEELAKSIAHKWDSDLDRGEDSGVAFVKLIEAMISAFTHIRNEAIAKERERILLEQEAADKFNAEQIENFARTEAPEREACAQIADKHARESNT